MAQRVQSVQEFLQDAFVPLVAALCSEEAERVTRKNNLGFCELVKPFCRLTSEVHMRDPNNQLHIIKNLKIAVNNITTQPPQPGAIRKLLNDVVTVSQPTEGLVANVITAGDYDLNISDRSVKASVPWYSSWKDTLMGLNTSTFYSATTPWFESYRESFLQSMPASEHEFLNHYVACMLVVSSSEPEPVEQFLKLSQEQHRIQHSNEYSYPKWFIPNTLKYYVLLHDVSAGEEQRADSVYEEMKQRYGTQGCYLLKINSRGSNRGADEQIPDPWSQYLQKNIIQNQEPYEDGPYTVIPNKHADHFIPLDGLDNDSKDGLSNNFKTHPLQLEHTSNSGCFDGNDYVKPNPPIHETKKSNTWTPHGTCLTLTDHDRIRQFIQEFTFRGLLPHIEKTIRQLNDQLISRKGLSRSLFSATKKWFSGSKVPEKSVNELKSTSGLLYPPEAPELQIRKMADLCFLVQHYELAYSCYHTAKKDFLNDQAMLYAAGALEMAAVSAFLQPGAPRPYPAHYMDTAIQTYRDICKNMMLAERCVLLSAEILKSQSKYSEAAALLIRLTSEQSAWMGMDSDLRSALLLEQAAHCFINMKSPMVRKFAFHMILAGHRYSKAGQKKHALRCYCQAMQVYKGKGWSLAEDHINFTIGRQSFTLRQLDNAISAFRHILINDSKQTAAQQGAFLREYLYVYRNVSQLSPDGPLPQLPLPYINSSATRVFFGHDRRPAEGEKQAATHISLDQEYDSDFSQQWKELEEQVVSTANKGIPLPNFQPTQYCLNKYSDNSRFPIGVVEEPITVEVAFRNPLKVPLLLTDVSLLWKFQPKDFSSKINGQAKELETCGKEMIGAEVISEFLISSEETKMARLKLFPHQTGELHILGVAYNLGSIQGTTVLDGIDASVGLQTGKYLSNGMSVRGRQDLEIQGPRLNNTKEEKTSIKYGPDRRLDPIITEEMPLLEVFFINFPTELLCGEIRKTYVEFVNVSKCSLTGVKVVSKRPEFFTFGGSSAIHTPLSPSASEHCSAYKTVVSHSTSLSSLTSSTASSDFGVGSGSQPEVMDVPLPDCVLLPGASVQLPMWLRGPDEEGVHEINFLFYYESLRKHSKLCHRVLRHTAVICTSRSLTVQATVFRSNALENEKGEGDNMLVFVDVENINTSEAGVKEFHVVQVSSNSRNWKLKESINLSEDKDIKLANREKGKLCLKSVRCKHFAEHYTFADIVFGSEQIISSTSPCADFFFRSLYSELKRTQAQQSMNTSQAPAKQSLDDTVRLIQKCNEVDLSIIVLWKAYVVEDNKQLILEGQHHVLLHAVGNEAFSFPQKQGFKKVLGNSDWEDLEQESPEIGLLNFFRPESTSVPAKPSLDQLSNLIKTRFHYPESFDHSFHQKSLCVVPVTLLLSNCSQTDVDVIIDLRHKTTSAEILEIPGSFTWLGKTQYRLQVKSQEVSSLQLKACFARTGVYNLGTPRVFAKLSDQVTLFETSQQNSMPALIIINNN
ncbi:trafficking protein particle complex subunit 8 isoform X2 [Anolis carolinensis]|uniref:trafficking protein particle complex subunit 8 isoform X2 n=1 Tax=Anolis carolinensis TaxID=28377 RepID=UPI0007DB78F1|nr:PREDICTED: trafficking protein particle complex subunit 8 isoform X2 [Anolis carolinensis]|eukprot:XP_016850628.1 PREDICTED: trafficking protein particle complex subunit 8 isoform X2 [Anolis carolinensis]